MPLFKWTLLSRRNATAKSLTLRTPYDIQPQGLAFYRPTCEVKPQVQADAQNLTVTLEVCDQNAIPGCTEIKHMPGKRLYRLIISHVH